MGLLYNDLSGKFKWWYFNTRYSNNTTAVSYVIPKYGDKRAGFILGNANNSILLIGIAYGNTIICETIYKSSDIGTTPQFTISSQDTTNTIEVSNIPTWGTYVMCIF